MMTEKKRYFFKAPGDGAYRVLLMGEDPGASTEISFLGGGGRTVELPSGEYTALIQPLGASEHSQQSLTLDSAAAPVELQDPITWGGAFLARPQTARPSWTPTPEARENANHPQPQAEARGFSIGISVDEKPGSWGGWRAETPELTQAAGAGAGLAVTIRRPVDWKSRPRWRLTIGVEGGGLWRVPLPLFRGGLELTLTPVATPTGADLSLTLAPKDPVEAALITNLHQTFGEDSKRLVRAALSSTPPGGPRGDPVDVLSQRLDDPWLAAAAALLSARNGEIQKVQKGVQRLYEDYPWLPDAAVAVAWLHAATRGDRDVVEARCLEAIVSARLRGATYFIAADALAADMLTALSIGAVDLDVRTKAKKELGVWSRRSRRRMPTAPFLSWEDPAKGPQDWQLSTRDYAILAKGRLTESALQLETKPAPRASKKRQAKQAPALTRPITSSDDSNKGRFGGKARRDGFTLGAKFARATDDWVRISLRVKAPATSEAKSVEIFLHDTFAPDRVVRPFNDGVAEYVTLAYGGFTVGAWIADAGVELELDLAEVKGAPRAIATL